MKNNSEKVSIGSSRAEVITTLTSTFVEIILAMVVYLDPFG